MEIIQIFNPSQSGCSHTIIKARDNDGNEYDNHFVMADLTDVNYVSTDPVFCAVRKAIFERGLQKREDLTELIGLKF